MLDGVKGTGKMEEHSITIHFQVRVGSLEQADDGIFDTHLRAVGR